MTEKDYIRVEDGNVVISGALPSTADADVAGTYASLGCIIGDVTISDGKEPITVSASNWCSAGQAILNQVRKGNRTVSISMTLEMDITDTATLAALTTYKSDTDAGSKYFIRDVASTNNDTPETLTNEYAGIFTQFDRTYLQAGTARFAVTYNVNTIVQDNVVA